LKLRNGEWGPDTPWRQGHVLAPDCVKQLLGLEDPPDAETIAVIASHDCDLAQSPDSEPYCEVMIGHSVERQDGNFAWAKSARQLHLPFTAGEIKLVAALNANQRKLIKKTDLADHKPAPKVLLTPNERTIFQMWLASRYRRAAFPDEFVRRLSARPANLAEKLTKILAATEDHIVAIFFDLDKGTEIERAGTEDAYELTILLVYSTEGDPGVSLKTATQAAKAIKELFQKTYRKDGKWHDVELRDVFPISEEGVTLRQSRMINDGMLII